MLLWFKLADVRQLLLRGAKSGDHQNMRWSTMLVVVDAPRYPRGVAGMAPADIFAQHQRGVRGRGGEKRGRNEVRWYR